MSLQISLYSPEAFKGDEGASIIFEITNTSSRPVHVLEWYTPLEGLRSPCLAVTVEKKAVAYDGIKVKRGTPTAENFIVIAPGESVSNKVNLDESYNLPLRGNVRVSFDASQLVAADLSNSAKTAALFPEARKRKMKKIDIVGCNFRLQRSAKKVSTIGMQLRTMEKAGPRIRGTAKDPLTEGMSDDEKRKMKAAHVKGHTLATNSKAALANDAKYKKWFGAHTAARLATAKGVYTKVVDGLESKQFTYVNNGPLCRANDIAYTSDGSDKIWICQAFWTLPATGQDSQAGTVVHEHSHTSAKTNDHKYGTPDCIQLAKDDPDKAIDNADNFEYYSET